MQALKQTSWSDVTLDSDPKSAFCTFYNKLDAARDLAFPEVVVKPKLSRMSHNMFPRLLMSCKTKSKLFVKKTKSPSSQNCLKF